MFNIQGSLGRQVDSHPPVVQFTKQSGSDCMDRSQFMPPGILKRLVYYQLQQKCMEIVRDAEKTGR